MNRDWLEKDFYRLLGVGKDADQATIKKAYRRLAQKLHPDANPDDPNAAERFKGVSEAYSVLSDADRRREYDQVRSMGAQGFGAGGGPFAGGQVRIEDLFGAAGGIGDLFNFGRGARGPQRGSDVSATLDLTFEESVRGTTSPVRCRARSSADAARDPEGSPGLRWTCAGTAAAPHGRFQPGFLLLHQPVPRVRRRRQERESYCRQCGGSGQEIRARTIRVRIPPGIKDGNTIRLRGRGAPGPRGGPPGDLLVKVRVGKHPLFSRKGNDLTMQLPITFTEAALGAKVRVLTLNGPVTLKIPAGTPSGKTFRIRKEGVRRDSGRPGDLLVSVQVTVPEKLPKDARKLLKEFKDKYETADPRAHL